VVQYRDRLLAGSTKGSSLIPLRDNTYVSSPKLSYRLCSLHNLLFHRPPEDLSQGVKRLGHEFEHSPHTGWRSRKFGTNVANFG